MSNCIWREHRRRKVLTRNAMEPDTPTWQPLSMLPTIRMLIDDSVIEAREHLALMSSVRDRPHVVDDDTVARSIALYADVRDGMRVYEEQLKRWAKGSTSNAEQREITRLAAQIREWTAAVNQILLIDDELKLGTIQSVLAKSDEEVGLEALRRPIGAQDLEAARALLNPNQLETALHIDTTMKALLAEGCDEMDILVRMFDHMEPFKRLLDTAPREGLDVVTTRFPGFFMYTKLLENVAGGIASGEIKVPPAQ